MDVELLLFDIDDCMYPMSSGFSDHRNGEVVCSYMVEKLGFESHEAAKALRDEYFQRYHSTMKGLTIATDEGRLPKPFVPHELGEYWAEYCDFEKYVQPDSAFKEAVQSLRDEAGLKLAAFTNSPRQYALRCIEQMGLSELFPEGQVFAVEDVMPACKPEPAAFQAVLSALGVAPEATVMFEDSMKNIRACKALGMQTVLVDETSGIAGGEAALLADIPSPDDPAVDLVIQSVSQIRMAMPCLWNRRLHKPRLNSTDSYAASDA